MILSKGYALSYGSFDIFIYDSKIFFQLGQVGSISIPVEPYIGTWDYFVFVYDGKSMEVYVNGSLVASKPASGVIRSTEFDLEIGRDSERKLYYYVGLIDELQISNKALSKHLIVKMFHSSYAENVLRVSLPKGNASLFRVLNSNMNKSQEINVSNLKFFIDKNYTIKLEFDIISSKSKNVTILISTDRFTKLYEVKLVPSINHIEFSFEYIRDTSWYEPGGFYWNHLAKTRVLIVEDGFLVFNQFLTLWNLKLVNLMLMFLISFLLIALIITKLSICL
jgi:hypothetical protein